MYYFTDIMKYTLLLDLINNSLPYCIVPVNPGEEADIYLKCVDNAPDEKGIFIFRSHIGPGKLVRM